MINQRCCFFYFFPSALTPYNLERQVLGKSVWVHFSSCPIRTQDGWVRSANATAVLCRPLFYRIKFTNTLGGRDSSEEVIGLLTQPSWVKILEELLSQWIATPKITPKSLETHSLISFKMLKAPPGNLVLCSLCPMLYQPFPQNSVSRTDFLLQILVLLS